MVSSLLAHLVCTRKEKQSHAGEESNGNEERSLT